MLNHSTIKELVELAGDAFPLPSVYISRDPTLAAAEIIIKEDIPTIDFSLLINGNLEQRSAAIREIGEACADWGCFTVVNHGMPESLTAAMLEAFMGYFDLMAEERGGYSGKKPFEPIKWGTGYSFSDKDDVRYWRDFMRTIVHPTFHSPDRPSNFRKVSEEYSRRAREMGMELVRAICESLGLPETCMEDALELKSCSQLLVGNLYPPCPQPELAMGLPPHSEPSLLNILLQNETASCVQMLHHGRWVPVETTPTSFLVFIGDFTEIVSNGILKSPIHRVMLNNTSTRMSVLTFIAPPLETVMAPFPQLVDSVSKPQAFRAIKHKDFLGQRYQSQLNKSTLDGLRT